MRRAVRDFFSRRKAFLFRQPGSIGGRWLGALLLLGAGFGFYYELFVNPRPPHPLALAASTGLLLVAVAELLPRDRTTLAGVLRAGGLLAFVIWFVALIGSRI